MIYTEFFELPDYNTKEILRYAGGGGESPEVKALLNECLEECSGIFKGRVCYKTFPVSIENDTVDLSFSKVHSTALAKNLKDCYEAVIFAATVGIEIDRKILKYSHTDTSKAIFMQAIGAERIEALCDTFCDNLRLSHNAAGLFIRPRFSAGYGDLSLEFQREIISVLDCGRKIGITLNDSLLMSPSKSVTAIVGFGKTDEPFSKHDCRNCDKSDCEFRNIDYN